MMPLVLVAAAAVALAWPWIKVHYRDLYSITWRPDGRHIAAAALVAAAVLTYVNSASETTPSPTPVPLPAEGLDLRGKFVGTDAARDAAIVAAMCRELAEEIAWDGSQAEPLIKTGVAFDELRVRTRLLMCRGESLGTKHPTARDAIERYLNDKAGTSGGPLTPDARAAWASAYRDVAVAAEAATR